MARYAANAGLELIGEFVEVETGKGSNALAKRPQLLAALNQAKKAKAKLVSEPAIDPATPVTCCAAEGTSNG